MQNVEAGSEKPLESNKSNKTLERESQGCTVILFYMFIFLMLDVWKQVTSYGMKYYNNNRYPLPQTQVVAVTECMKLTVFFVILIYTKEIKKVTFKEMYIGKYPWLLVSFFNILVLTICNVVIVKTPLYLTFGSRYFRQRMFMYCLMLVAGEVVAIVCPAFCHLCHQQQCVLLRLELCHSANMEHHHPVEGSLHCTHISLHLQASSLCSSVGGTIPSHCIHCPNQSYRRKQNDRRK